jgi:hypothetical protein
MRSTEPDYWRARSAWSGTIVFLALTGLALLIGLPSAQLLGSEAPFSNQFQLLFPGAFLVLYAILTMNLGQMEANWGEPFAYPLFSGYQAQLFAKEGLAFGLTLPYWFIYQLTDYLAWPDTLLLMSQLFIWGCLTGLFGFALALGQHSEVIQFNLKYLVFIGFLAASLHPAISVINPFVSASLVLSSGAGALSAWIGPLIWLALAGILCVWIYRRLERLRKEPHESAFPSA